MLSAVKDRPGVGASSETSARLEPPWNRRLVAASRGRTPHPLRDFTRAQPFAIGYGTLASTFESTPGKFVVAR